MQKYKIVTLLKSFSAKEMKNFEDFLESPYLNTHKKPLQLFQILKKQKGKLDENGFPKEKIFEKIYGENKSFNNNTFNDLTSQLFRLAENFLYLESVKNNDKRKEIFLMQKYCEKGYETLFENKKKQMKSLLDGQKVDSEYFEDFYEMSINEFNYFQVHGTIKKQKDFNFALQKVLNLTATLTNYYLLELSSNYINTLVRRNIFDNKQVENDFRQIATHLFDDKFINLIRPYNEHQYILEIYKKMLEMFLYTDENYLYHDYKSIIHTNIDRFSSDEKYFHYSKLISYCSLRLIKNHDDIEIRKELSYVAKEVIYNKYYCVSRNKYIGVQIFRIFLDNFAYLKDSESIILLIDQCIPLMEKKFMDSHKNLSEMYLSIIEGKYESSLLSLGKISIDYFQLNYTVKCSYIKIHYHLNNIEQVLYEIENYMKFLTSNKGIPKIKKLRESNFAKAVKRIVIAEGKNKYDEISYLNHTIQKNQMISNKEWLLEITNNYLEKNKKIKIAH